MELSMDSVEAVGSRTPLGTLTPSQQNGETKDVDFTNLTPFDFGISTDSLLTFSRNKDKSRVAQLKSRRRSTIGVRGSPETNSLICFRAKNILASPMYSGRDTLKQKMAAFQRLMGEDEENLEQSVSPMWMDKDEGAALPKDAQSDADVCLKEKNSPAPSKYCPSVNPPSSKRHRRASQGLCKEKVEEKPLSDLPDTPRQDSGMCSEFKSPEAVLGLGSDSQSQLMSLPMLSKPEVIRTDDVSSVTKKKRVRFGVPLSPEFFDKTLPPSTPLRKGATPVCPPSSTERKSSLLKTPTRFHPPLLELEFSSPENNGASPVLSRSRYSSEEVDREKISFPILEEEFDNSPEDSKEAVLAKGPELTLHHEPPTAGTELMNNAFQEEEDPLPTSTADHPLTSQEAPEDVQQQHQPEEQPQDQLETSVIKAPRSRGRKRKQPAATENETETRRSSRTASAKAEMKEPAATESETETRRSSRTAAASAKGKMKTTARKSHFGSKEVDRSLYGKRDYASKNPLLSPILESAASSLTNTPTQPHLDANPDSNEATIHSVPQQNTPASGLVAAAALWRQRFLAQTSKSDSGSDLNSDSSARESGLDGTSSTSVSGETLAPTGSGGKAPRAKRCVRRPSGRRRSWNNARTKKLNSANKPVVDEDTERSNVEPDSEEPSYEELNGPSVGADLVSSSEKHQSTDPESELKTRSVQKSFGDEPEENQEGACLRMSETSEQRDKGEQREEQRSQEMSEHTHNEVSSVETLRDTNEPTLEPWQASDFNIEDVLKPVVKSRGSVRRSLRNRRSTDIQASGLAWVDHTSPDFTAKRRRNSRLSASFQPPVLPDTEEAPINEGQ